MLLTCGAKEIRTPDLLHAMEPKSVRNGTPPFAEVSADLRIRPLKAVMVQERSLRMVTSLVTSPVTSSASSNAASTSEMTCRGVGDARIMSPLLRGSQGSGGVLTWTSVPERPPVHGSELQPELQPLPRPGLGCRARRSVWDRTAVVTGIYAHSGADAVGRSAAASDSGSGRAQSAATGQCTPCGTCRTASAHPGSCARLRSAWRECGR